MLVLALFAFVAGAATALSPCVLPVLPVALSAGVTGGRRRPLGVVTGLVASFTFATVALVYVISALGLPDNLLRNLAIAVLVGFGLVLIVPRAAARTEAMVGRLTRRGPASPRGEGFGSGLVLGASLGLVYAPCAGPILAGVITVSASQDFGAGRLAVALSYAAGTAVVLYALMLGGRRLSGPLARRSARFQPAMGAVMVVVAVLMAAELDIRFQNEIADNLPAVLVNPSKELEETAAARERLADLRAPEFPFERDAGNVERAIDRNELRYAVAQDNDFATWRAYGNQYWPAKYLIDARGRVRYTHFGEGEYAATERAIRALLAEAGAERLGRQTRARADAASGATTPESYLGADRAERFVHGTLLEGTTSFELPPPEREALPPHHLAFEGRWRVEGSRAVAAADGARLHLRFAARDVFLVLGSRGRARDVDVVLDGRPRRSLRVTQHRLYDVVRLPRAGDHLLTVRLERGTEAYAFTFG